MSGFEILDLDDNKYYHDDYIIDNDENNDEMIYDNEEEEEVNNEEYSNYAMELDEDDQDNKISYDYDDDHYSQLGFTNLLDELIQMVSDMAHRVSQSIGALEECKRLLTHFIPECSLKPFRTHKSRVNHILERYFFSEYSSPPPPNKDVKERLKYGECNIADVKRFMGKHWNQHEANIVRNAIGKTLIAKKAERLQIQVNLMAMKRDNCVDKELIKVFTAKLALARHDLQNLYDMEPHEITRQCEYDVEEIAKMIDWHSLANKDMKQRLVTPDNIRLAWIHYFNPFVNIKDWSEEESLFLLDLVEKHGKHNWKKVADELKTKRTPFACLEKWKLLQRSTLVTKEWNAEADKNLCSIVKDMLSAETTNGIINWRIVSCRMNPYFKPDVCRTRWKTINPYVKKKITFSEEEDLQLLVAVHRYGTRWNLVARELNGHVDQACQRRYYELMESAQPWTYSEDRKLFTILRSISNRFQPPFSLARLYQFSVAVLPRFPGRNARSVSRRLHTLIQWNNLWYKLRDTVHGIPVDVSAIALNDKVPLTPWTNDDIRNVLLRTPFAFNLIQEFQKCNCPDPLERVLRIMKTFEFDETELGGDLSNLIRDFKNNLFVPRPIVCTNRKDETGEGIKSMLQILCDSQSKNLLFGVIHSHLSEYLNEEISNNIESARHLQELLKDDCYYYIRLEQAWTHAPTAKALYECVTVENYIEIVPKLAHEMALPWKRYRHHLANRFNNYNNNNDNQPEPSSSSIRSSNIVLPIRKMELFQQLRRLVQQYRHGPALASRPKLVLTQNDSPPIENCLALRFLSNEMQQRLLLPTSKRNSYKKAVAIYKKALAIGQDGHFLSAIDSQETIENIPNIRTIPPSFATIQLLQSLLLRRGLYIHECGSMLTLFQRITSGQPVRNQLNSQRQFSANEVSLYRSLLDSPHIRLFRARMLSLLFWPTVISKLSYSDLTANIQERITGFTNRMEIACLTDKNLGDNISARNSSVVKYSKPIRKSKMARELGGDDTEVKLDRTERKRLRNAALELLDEEEDMKPLVKRSKSMTTTTTTTQSNDFVGKENEDEQEEEEFDVKHFETLSEDNESILFMPITSGNGSISTLAVMPKLILHFMACGFSLESLTSRREHELMPADSAIQENSD